MSGSAANLPVERLRTGVAFETTIVDVTAERDLFVGLCPKEQVVGLKRAALTNQRLNDGGYLPVALWAACLLLVDQKQRARGKACGIRGDPLENRASPWRPHLQPVTQLFIPLLGRDEGGENAAKLVDLAWMTTQEKVCVPKNVLGVLLFARPGNHPLQGDAFRLGQPKGVLEPISCTDPITEAQRHFRSKALEPGMAGIERDRVIKPGVYGRKIVA